MRDIRPSMTTRAAVLAVCLALLACDARGAGAVGSATVSAASDSTASSSATHAASGAGGPSTAPSSVPVIDAPAQGDVASIVRDALATAASQRRKLLVYAGATWCKPCQRFHAALASGRLDTELSDVAFLKFDIDRDQDRLRADGYQSHLLPMVVVPASDGAPSGKQIEGGISDDSAVDGFVARIRRMLAES